MSVTLSLRVNGKAVSAEVDPGMELSTFFANDCA